MKDLNIERSVLRLRIWLGWFAPAATPRVLLHGVLAVCLLAWCGSMAAADKGEGRADLDLAADEAGPVELSAEPSLDEYLAYASFNNNRLRAAYQDWVAAVERIPQAESLPDPRLSYGYYFSAVETRVGPQRQRVELAQMLPWVGKRALRGDVAAAAAEREREQFEGARRLIHYRVTDVYAEYYYLARAIDITRENLELLTYWERLAQARYRVATGRHSDVIRVQVEIGKLADRVQTLEELRWPLSARLNAALGRAVDAPLPWPRELKQSRAMVDDVDTREVLGRSSPELRALDADISREDSAIELARKDFFPDVSVGLQWIETGSRSVSDLDDNGKDAIIGTLSFNLPVWWNRYGAGVREAQARRSAAIERRRDRESELLGELGLAIYGLEEAERKVSLYGNSLIPKARESLAATFTAYESGEADFLDVLDAQRVLLDFRLARERALANHEQRLAESEMLAGRSLRIVDGGDRAAEDRR